MDKKTEDCLFWGNEDGVGISSQKKCSGSVLMSVPFSSLFGRNSPLPTSFICLEKQYKFWESKSLKHTNHRIILKGFLKCSTIKKKITPLKLLRDALLLGLVWDEGVICGLVGGVVAESMVRPQQSH